MEAPLIYIIILNWKRKHDTDECLRSVAKINYPNFKTVMVDNGSADGSAEYIKTRYPHIDIIENKTNLGWAGGNNVGIGHALSRQAEYVLLLNNDTVVDPHILKAFVAEAQNHPGGAIFCAKIYYDSPPDTLWYAGGTWIDQDLCFIHEGKDVVDDHQKYERVCETDYATGCALFTPVKIIHKVGLFNPRYFLLYEETDWCYRAKTHGYKCFVAPQAKVWHKGSLSLGGPVSSAGIYYDTRNVFLWGERHLSKKDFFRLLRNRAGNIFRLNLEARHSGWMIRRLYRAIVSLRKRLSRDKGDPISRARYLGLRDYILRRFGQGPDEISGARRL